MKQIFSIDDINKETEEGKMLMACIALFAVNSYKTAEDILARINEVKNAMYPNGANLK